MYRLGSSADASHSGFARFLHQIKRSFNRSFMLTRRHSTLHQLPQSSDIMATSLAHDLRGSDNTSAGTLYSLIQELVELQHHTNTEIPIGSASDSGSEPPDSGYAPSESSQDTTGYATGSLAIPSYSPIGGESEDLAGVQSAPIGSHFTVGQSNSCHLQELDDPPETPSDRRLQRLGEVRAAPHREAWWVRKDKIRQPGSTEEPGKTLPRHPLRSNSPARLPLLHRLPRRLAGVCSDSTEP